MSSYQKKTWADNEVISADALNNMEGGISEAHKAAESAAAEAEKRLPKSGGTVSGPLDINGSLYVENESTFNGCTTMLNDTSIYGDFSVNGEMFINGGAFRPPSTEVATLRGLESGVYMISYDGDYYGDPRKHFGIVYYDSSLEGDNSGRTYLHILTYCNAISTGGLTTDIFVLSYIYSQGKFLLNTHNLSDSSKSTHDYVSTGIKIQRLF